MAKINKQALKAYFQTGKIPTQSNFADLIDSVMNIPDGGEDSTLVLGDGDKNGAPYVNGFRFVNNRDQNTYIFITVWDNNLGDDCPVVILHLPTNSPTYNSDTILYHVLDRDEAAQFMSGLTTTFHDASDDELVSCTSAVYGWYNIFNRYNNNPSAPRIIQNGVSTYFVYPCKQNNEWYVGYVVEDEVDMGGSNQLYRLTPVGNSQLKWNISDGAIITDLGNSSKWTRKIM